MSRITLPRWAFALPSAALGAAVALAPPAAAAPADPLTQAACDFGWQFTTYDWANYDDYARRVLDRSTGEFRGQFEGTVPDRRAQAQITHTRAEAVAVECRTDAADPQHAQAVITVDQNTASDATFGIPQQARTVLRVNLDNVGGRWLAGRVEPVAPPPR
ncbi:hypothetical protein NDR87_07105 [Nocardia sp. CDC159]|uniref:Mce-associated membrane protein n=1 Tax=Nocardia pulmonis TaxID=2951408 RepID=A0A9X2E2U9_9NOCA|nr:MULTISPECIES: hypothetical protein [Nocardia]MCM6773234.1 hypothetical protein [Nocardia pulmonis]MCM6786121.1 hypothetical protein [Nocardia sp. CDC159]